MGDAPDPAPATAGLNNLDQQRAGSLADEGGASGAAVERQERQPRSASGRKSWDVAAFALGLLAAWHLARRR